MNGTGLFKNFLQHEMVVPALFNRRKIHIQFGYKGGYLFITQVFKD